METCCRHVTGVLLSLSLAPKWLQTVAAFNPLSYAVDAARAAFNNRLADVSVVRGFALIGLLAALSLIAAVRPSSRAFA